MANKPTVHYDVAKFKYIMVGFPAIVYPIDHQSEEVSNTKASRTSAVLKLDGYDFETENTKYVGVVRSDVDKKALRIPVKVG